MTAEFNIISRADAKREKLFRYFTGQPCIYGHISEREVVNANCLECRSLRVKKLRNKYHIPKKQKPLMKFWIDKSRYFGAVCEMGHVSMFHKTKGCLECFGLNINGVRERLSGYAAKYRNQNLERSRERCREFIKNNPEKAKFNALKRRFFVKKGSFFFLFEEKIRQFYKNCPYGMHVDHIVPIQNKNICGLNVPWNFQYLSSFDNLSKHNKFPTCQRSMQPAWFDDPNWCKE